MEKCAALSNLLQNKPDKLSFSVLSCGKIKVAGMDELFTVDEVRRMLQERLKCSSSLIMTMMEDLEVNKYASIPVTQEMIPAIEKIAENTAVVVDMYEVDYNPVTEGASTQAIDKHFDAVNDFVSRMTFPDTTVSDIVVGPKEQIFKKNKNTPTRPDLPQDTNVPTRARASIWTKAYGLQPPEDALYELWKQDKNAFPAQAEQLLRERYQFSAHIAFERVNRFLQGRNEQARFAPQRKQTSSWRKLADELRGGKADDLPDSQFEPKQLQMGIGVEKEHTPSLTIRHEIAKDHLTEMPDYYTQLKKMEEAGKRVQTSSWRKMADIVSTPLQEQYGRFIQKAPEITEPQKPYKRQLSRKERYTLLRMFPEFSFSSYVDALGRIMLGGGVGSKGLFYVTEEGLAELSRTGTTISKVD